MDNIFDLLVTVCEIMIFCIAVSLMFYATRSFCKEIAIVSEQLYQQHALYQY